MKSSTLKISITSLFFLITILYFSQNTKGQGSLDTIYFDKSGKLTGEVPELINVNDKLTVKIPTLNEEKINDYTEFESKWKSANAYFAKLKEDNQGPFLRKVYNIDLDSLIIHFDEKKTGYLTQLMNAIDSQIYYINKSGFLFKEKEKGYFATVDFKNETDYSISKIQFDVERIPALKDFIFKHYTTSVCSTYKKIDFHKIVALKSKSDEILSTYKSIDIPYHQFIDPYLKAKPIRKIEPGDGKGWLNKQIDQRRVLLPLLTELNTSIEIFFKQTKANKDWVLEWLWYTGGKPMLNPFPFCDPDEITIPDTSDIFTFKEKILARTTLIKSLSGSNEKSLKKIDSLIDDRNKLSVALFNSITEYKKYQKLLTENNKNIDNFRTIRERLNSLTLFASDKNKAREPFLYMRHHDAIDGYALMNSLTHDEYLEEDRVIILNHNLKPGQNPEISYKMEAIANDRPEWIGSLIDILKQLSNISTSTDKEFVGNDTLKIIFSKLNKTSVSAFINITDSTNKEIKRLRVNLNYLNQIPIQNNPYKLIKEKQPDSARFHSGVCNIPKKIKGATMFIYSFTGDVNNKEKPPKDTFNFRVNKLYRILPTAGFTFTPYPDFIDVTYTKSAIPVVTQKIVHPVNFIVGLKVHPFRKIDIRDTRSCFNKDDKKRCLFWSRLSLTAAFSVTRPLENLFAGIGLDIYPGFCLTAGAHFNKYTDINLKGGNAIEKNTYRTGLYFGVLSDLALVGEIAKIFGFK